MVNNNVKTIFSSFEHSATKTMLQNRYELPENLMEFPLFLKRKI